MSPVRAAVLATVLSVTLSAAAARKPNVLYVLSDMQRAYSLGCYGDQNARTPKLDRFATEGLRLDGAISPTPVCCPHRACLMSGQYAHHNGRMSDSWARRPTLARRRRFALEIVNQARKLSCYERESSSTAIVCETDRLHSAPPVPQVGRRLRSIDHDSATP